MAKAKSKAHRTEGPLDASPSHLLHRVLQLALDIYTSETGPDGLTQRQYAVLTAVAHNEGLTQTDLVRATGIDRSTLADLVARMISKNLLERQRSAVDARANTVRLTDAGREALAAAGPRVEAADRRILALLPRGKRDGFLGVLRAVAHAGEAAVDSVVEGAAEGLKKAKKEAKAAKRAKADKPDKKKKKARKAAKAPKPEKSEA